MVTNRVLVAGDVHLGSSNANAGAFEGFLDDVYRDHERVSEVVLVGDLWDMVRRDPFGCAWESPGTITRLQQLADRLPVRIVLGNHDAYLRTVDHARYDVDFVDEYVLDQDGVSVRFCHGNAFDRFQFDAVSRHLSGPGDRGDIDPTNGAKDPYVATVREYARSGRQRLRSLFTDTDAPTYPGRERRAHAHLRTVPEDKLIYGHTHAPYVHHDNLAANPGSWKATAPVHNTYLAVEAGHIELYRYRRSGDDERLG